jgi:HSP20 family protein
MTMLFEPFAPLFELSRELNRFASSDTPFRSFIPAADTIVTDDEVTIVMDVPGFSTDDLNIELVDDVLTIRGERSFPYETGEDDGKRVWQRLERGFGKFERVLRVPKGLDADHIQAEMTDGVLTLKVPVVTRKPKRVEIGRGSQATIEQTTTTNETKSDERELVGSTS